MMEYTHSMPEKSQVKQDLFEVPVEPQTEIDEGEWYPQSRYPDSLFVAYSGNQENLSSFALQAAQADLMHFQIPVGLTEDSFRAFIGMMLLQEPIIKFVDDAVVSEHRFGEMIGILRLHVREPKVEMKSLWQIIMRWLLFFLPERYMLKTYNYSEMLQRIN